MHNITKFSSIKIKKRGIYQEVYNGVAEMTRGGLKKKDLIKVNGKIEVKTRYEKKKKEQEQEKKKKQEKKKTYDKKEKSKYKQPVFKYKSWADIMNEINNI